MEQTQSRSATRSAAPAKLMTTLLHELARRGGGGLANATLIERLS